MRKFVRWTAAWFGLPSAVLAAGIYFLALPTAKLVFAAAGSYTTGVDVSIDRLALDYRPWPLFASAPAVLYLSGVRVANPPGFEAPDFMTIRRIDVHFTPASLATDPVVLSKVELHGALLNLERRDLISNAGLILTRLAAFETRDPPFGFDSTLAIDRLLVRDGSAQLAYAGALGRRGQRTVSLNHRVLAPAAAAGKGVSSTGLLHAVIDQVVSEVLVEVARKGEAREKLKARISN